MSHSYSLDLRMRVISAISGGLSTHKAAARFDIGVATAGRWYRRYRDFGETAARKQGQPGGSKLDRHAGFILGLVADQPDIALHEIAARLEADHQVSVCPATVCTFFKKRGMTFKKRRRMPRSRNGLT